MHHDHHHDHDDHDDDDTGPDWDIWQTATQITCNHDLKNYKNQVSHDTRLTFFFANSDVAVLRRMWRIGCVR
jgi:hypothetical protein